MSNEGKIILEIDSFTQTRQVILSYLGFSSANGRYASSVERANYRAIKNWLSKYIPPAYASNLQKVIGLIESLYHLCQVKDWLRFRLLINLHITSNENRSYELYHQLEAWGYFTELLKIYQKLEEELEIPFDLTIIALVGLGNVYTRLADYQKGISYSQTALERSQKVNDFKAMASSLINLGVAQAGLGKFKQAIYSFESSLEIAEGAQLRPEKAKALGNLGNAYGNKRKFKKAINYLEKSLEIILLTDDRILEGQVLGNLGNAYGYLGDYDSALKYFEQSLAVARELGNRSGETAALNSLGELYRRTKKYQIALEKMEQVLPIARQIGDRLTEEIALGNLGSVYGDMGDYERAISYQNQSLIIAQSIGDRQGVFLAQLNLLLVKLLIKFSGIKQFAIQKLRKNR
jgi:tetratricopeptide (TPR) repeat protein